MIDLKRCTEILEIRHDASLDEARQAFRDLVSIWHPDKYCHNARLMEKADRKLKEINWAWEQFQSHIREQEQEAEERERKEAERRRQLSIRKPLERMELQPADLDIKATVSADLAQQAYQALQGRNHIYDPDQGLARKTEEFRTGGDKIRSNPSAEERANLRDTSAGADRETSPHSTHRAEPEQKQTPEAQRRRTADSATGTAQKQQREVEQELNRKMQILSETYMNGRRVREFQERHEREQSRRVIVEKQEKARADLKQMHRVFTERYLIAYHSWITQEREKFDAAERERQMQTGIYRILRGIRQQKEFPYAIPHIQMLFIQGGTFRMGLDEKGSILSKLVGHASSHPRHTVTLNNFYLGKYPVTVKQWSRAMGIPIDEQGHNLPIQLSWSDVQKFIAVLNGVTGLSFRLPSEAEWEYAARSGGRDEQWPEACTDATLTDHASPGREQVGQHQPNELGLYDMIGNVGEWTNDWYDPKFYSRSEEIDPHGPEQGDRKVVRGNVSSDVVGNPVISDCFSRSSLPVNRFNRAGFRLAHSML